jgi:HK97 gp10 family phage protein
MINLQITGTSELANNLRKLSKKAMNEAGQAAIQEAVLPTLIRAKQLAPRDTGALRASIGTRFRKYKRGNLLYAVIGARYDEYDTAKGKRVPGNYAHLVELGHALLQDAKGRTGMKALKGKSLRKKTATIRGTVQKRPFMRPAWEETKDEALRRLSDVFGTKVIEAAQRLSRRRKRA